MQLKERKFSILDTNMDSSLEEKLEELEDDNLALKEFVMNKLSEFEKKLNQPIQMPQTSTPKRQTIIIDPETASGGLETIPKDLDEVDPVLREKIAPFVPKTIQAKEKMSKVQIAYVNYWIDDHECTGKST